MVMVSSCDIISSRSCSHIGHTTSWASGEPTDGSLGSLSASSLRTTRTTSPRVIASVAAQAIAAARTALAVQDAGAHQVLQDLLEIALGNALALGDVAAAHRVLADMERHVEHRFDREHRLLAEPRHGPFL